MRKLALLAGIAALALAGVAYAASSPVMVGTKLDSMQDHATKSHGTGSFTGDITGGKLKFTLKFSHLTGAASAAHIHLGAKGVSGPVLIALCGPCKSGMRNIITISEDAEKAITTGKTYVNVHTAKNKNGEIRGQVKSRESKAS